MDGEGDSRRRLEISEETYVHVTGREDAGHRSGEEMVAAFIAAVYDNVVVVAGACSADAAGEVSRGEINGADTYLARLYVYDVVQLVCVESKSSAECTHESRSAAAGEYCSYGGVGGGATQW